MFIEATLIKITGDKMKKDIMITIRLSEMEKEAVSKIKTIEPSFQVSKFLREALIEKSNSIVQSPIDGSDIKAS